MPPDRGSEEELLIVPVPALVAVLIALENDKGAPLTEQEVLRARDGAGSIAMPRFAAEAVAKERGYLDLDPEDIWNAWQAFRRR
jgi:hypothetical protein